ncbi:hypothetical protein [Kosakonia phage Kc304]|uniref:Uncharacterized protein n=2 Tax=Winklervirus chi14 TaxID=2560752 RepID=A0A1Z1LY84_9CAUD|nr:hypothetical protein FDI23_gp101 [Serratia phage CHI14]ARW57524.1 hypothetical protein [Serratia phage CHI14]ARW57799.1 hypothetical protein [Serratia phage CBH8]QYN80545.1 hypothetical protein [Kosakonia phage Kc304]
MIGTKKQVAQTKLVELTVGDDIFINRGGSVTKEVFKYIIRMVHKSDKKTLIYAQHISTSNNHLLIIDLLGKTYSIVGETDITSWNLCEVYSDAGHTEVIFNDKKIPCRHKRVNSTVFSPVATNDILWKCGKGYTVVGVAGDGTLFLTDPEGKASMLNPRDKSALTAFGLENA